MRAPPNLLTACACTRGILQEQNLLGVGLIQQRSFRWRQVLGTEWNMRVPMAGHRIFRFHYFVAAPDVLTYFSVESASAWHQRASFHCPAASALRPGLNQGLTRPHDWRRARRPKCPNGYAIGNSKGMVVKTGTLEIIVDCLQAAEQLGDLAMHLPGFVVGSRVRGSDGRTRSVQQQCALPPNTLMRREHR
jgi:hypothetical protein